MQGPGAKHEGELATWGEADTANATGLQGKPPHRALSKSDHRTRSEIEGVVCAPVFGVVYSFPAGTETHGGTCEWALLQEKLQAGSRTWIPGRSWAGRPRTYSNSCPLVSDAIQPSHLVSSFSPPAFRLSQHQGLFKCPTLQGPCGRSPNREEDWGFCLPPRLGPLPLHQTLRSPERPRQLHRIPRLSEAAWDVHTGMQTHTHTHTHTYTHTHTHTQEWDSTTRRE